MSLRALTWAWEQELTNPSEKLVLLAIADHANDDGMCWPSMSHVAERCLLSTRQIQRITEQLVDYGLVTRERRKRPDGTLGTYTYTLNIHRTPMSGRTGHPRPVVHRTPVSAQNRHNRTVIEPTHDHFDRFWQLYPRKIAKQKCARWWQRNTDMVSPVILDGIQRWADYWQQSNTETRYIPHPYTWLTQERWYDDPPPVTISRGTLTSGIDLANQLLADIEEGT
jgi:hypothetical protein